MCGICGVVRLGDAAEIDVERLRAMMETLKHRGPDDEGIFANHQVALGIRRLSIIDLEGGHQPIFNEDQTKCVVLNGEIYNYVELGRDLENRGHTLRTQSDTEVIVHAYEEWGDRCVEHLRGMFSFAVWDQMENKLLIARDRLGQKPLYYSLNDQRLVFASEIKAILAWDPTLRSMDIAAMDDYLTLGYVPAPRTMLKDIRKLPAGYLLTQKGRQHTLRPYWDLDFQAQAPGTWPDCLEQMGELVQESVRLRLRSDVPLGAFLSGGIDSGTIVGLMSRYSQQPIKTFSVGFPDGGVSELPFAKILSEHFGTQHYELIIEGCAPEIVERLVWHLDEPIADPAAVPTFLLSKFVKEHVKVILTGEGGDELFGGYDYYRADRWATRYQWPPASIRRVALPVMAQMANRLIRRPKYHPRTIWFWSLPPGSQMVAWVAVFTDEEKRRCYHPSFHAGAPRSETAEAFSRHYHRCQAQDRLHRLMYIDTKVWLPDDLLMKIDKSSMAHSIEARTPFLDHHLFEYVASIPSHWKLRKNTSKYILKALVGSRLPSEIVARPKRTFDVPLREWLLGDLKEMMLDIFSVGVLKGEQVFDPGYLTGRFYQGIEGGIPGYDRQAWSLICLGEWARQYRISLG